jgi:DNA-binding CsgD family transcriptional regulator
VSITRERSKESAIGLKEAFSLKYLGLSFFWAWCYCLWFVPSIEATESASSASANFFWLIQLGSAGLMHFALPLLLGKVRRLSSFRILYIVSPLVMTVGTIIFESVRVLQFSNTVLCLTAFLMGVSSALLWNLWGEFYASRKEGRMTTIAPTFGAIMTASLILTGFLPQPAAALIVALLPLLSGISYFQAKRDQDKAGFPVLQPKENQKFGWMVICKVCLIAFLACVSCTFLWALLPTDGFLLGRYSMIVGVLCGSIFMLAFSLLNFIQPSRFSIVRFFPCLLIIIVISFALFVAGENLYLFSYILSMSVSVLLDVFLVVYFGTFTSKGYARPSISFGYSEGFICIGMLLGSILGNFVTAIGFASPVMIGTALFFMCFIALLSISLTRQEFSITIIMSTPLNSTEFENRCHDIAREFALSGRETEIFLMLAHGYNTKTIAKRLVISYYTAQTHVRNIYAKLNVHSRTDLLALVDT